MLLLQIIGKGREESFNNKVLEFKYAKKYIMEWLINQQEQLNEDRKICLSNVEKIQKTNNQIEELKTKAKSFSMTKCLNCKSQLKPPFFFLLVIMRFVVNVINILMMMKMKVFLVFLVKKKKKIY
jgi:hypothetical protein